MDCWFSGDFHCCRDLHRGKSIRELKMHNVIKFPNSASREYAEYERIARYRRHNFTPGIHMFPPPRTLRMMLVDIPAGAAVDAVKRYFSPFSRWSPPNGA